MSPSSPASHVCLAAAALWIAAKPALAGSYIFMTLNDSPTSTSAATAIDTLNQVAGYDFNTPSGNAEGFVWSHGVYTTASEGANDTRFLAINAKGFVAGQYRASGGSVLPFLYHIIGQRFYAIKLNAGLSGYVAGMNASDDVAGYLVGSGYFADPRGLLTKAAKAGIIVFPGAKLSTLASAINDSGVVTGSYQISSASSTTHGFTYQAGSYTAFDVPGATATFPNAIDAAGTIGGGYSDVAYNIHGFVDQAGSFSLLDYPGGNTTVVAALGAPGQVLGNYLDANSNNHAFLYQNGTYISADYPHAMETTIAAANAAGSYVGYWVDSNFVSHAFLAMCPAVRSPCTP